jgi:hypothetical protein
MMDKIQKPSNFELQYCIIVLQYMSVYDLLLLYNKWVYTLNVEAL